MMCLSVLLLCDELDVRRTEHFVISVSQYRSCQCVATVVS